MIGLQATASWSGQEAANSPSCYTRCSKNQKFLQERRNLGAPEIRATAARLAAQSTRNLSREWVRRPEVV